MTTCISCSMPLFEEKDFGAETPDGPACVHCVTPEGAIKSCEDVFEGGVGFFMQSVPGTDRALAERIVRKNMNALPYWQEHKGSCLEGEAATDEEYADALSKLQNT